MAMRGKDLVTLARDHVGEPYVLGIHVAKDNWEWQGPWDCAEFASWLVYQVADSLYGCDDDSNAPSVADAYTGYWVRDVRGLGRKISVEEAARTPGAFVLRAPLDGVMGHIVVSDGEGGTIEAHSTKRGVIEASLSERRWDTGVLIPDIKYEAGEPVDVPAPKLLVVRLTKPPMTGSVVREIQRALSEKGFDPGPIDGSFGALTRAAVGAFQAASGLLVDGEVGEKTARALGIELPSAAFSAVRSGRSVPGKRRRTRRRRKR
jgi:hypothetical protein